MSVPSLQKVMLSIASAVAMAVRMTQLNLQDRNGTLPLDVDFFNPILSPNITVPTAPNLEFVFSRQNDFFYDLYDFYMFRFNLSVVMPTDGAAHVNNETIAPIGGGPQIPPADVFASWFHLSSAILAPVSTVVEVTPVDWPKGRIGPNIDLCLQSACLTSRALFIYIALCN